MADTNNHAPASADQTPDEEHDRMWLEAEWRALAELDREHPNLDTGTWPARIRIDQGTNRAKTTANVDVFCVSLWHAGDETALYCDDWRTEDTPFAWQETVEATLALLPDEIRAAHRRIEVGRDIPNTEPQLRWQRRMRDEEEYVIKDLETNEPATDTDGLMTADEGTLEADCHEALDYNDGQPDVPDGCDMDPAVNAGFNHIAIRTKRGNLWELCSLSGMILWDDYRAS